MSGALPLLENKVVVISGVGPALGTTLARRCAEAGADLAIGSGWSLRVTISRAVPRVVRARSWLGCYRPESGQVLTRAPGG